MAYKYNRTIIDASNLSLRRSMLWRLLQTHDVGNGHLNQSATQFEFESPSLFVRVNGEFYPSAYQEDDTFYGPLKMNELQCYVNVQTNPSLKGGKLLHHTELTNLFLNLLVLVKNYIPPFIIIHPHSLISIHPNEEQILVSIKGELKSDASFASYKKFASWLQNVKTNNLICADCGGEGNLNTLCDCWMLQADISMSSV